MSFILTPFLPQIFHFQATSSETFALKFYSQGLYFWLFYRPFLSCFWPNFRSKSNHFRPFYGSFFTPKCIYFQRYSKQNFQFYKARPGMNLWDLLPPIKLKNHCVLDSKFQVFEGQLRVQTPPVQCLISQFPTLILSIGKAKIDRFLTDFLLKNQCRLDKKISLKLKERG